MHNSHSKKLDLRTCFDSYLLHDLFDGAGDDDGDGDGDDEDDDDDGDDDGDDDDDDDDGDDGDGYNGYVVLPPS